MESIGEETEGSDTLRSPAASRGREVIVVDLPKDSVFQSNELKSLEQIAHDLERSVPVRNNRYHLKVYNNTFVGSECVDYLVRSGVASSRSEGVEIGRRLATELNLFQHVTLEHELKDDFFFYRFTDSSRRTSRIEGAEIKLHVDEDLSAISKILIQEIDIRDRTYRLTKYKDVFVASEAVSVMIEQNFAKSRDEAVELGRRLQKEASLWHHVCHDHNFKDDYLFFRFTRTSEESNPSVNNVFGDTSSVLSGRSISVSVVDLSPSQLHSIAEQLRRGLRVKDRMFRFMKYRMCFVASEAVDFLVKENLARSREEAVDLGRRLAKEFSLWHHVTNDHYFQDKYLFFRFSPASDQPSSSPIDEGNAGLDHSFSNSETLSEHSISLSEAAARLRRGLQVKDRMYKLKAYKKCFVGCDAVDFIVQARIVSSREEAVTLGQRLAEELDLFHHVTNDRPFEDGYFFYRFAATSTDDTTPLSAEEFSEDCDASEGHSIQSLSMEELSGVGEQLRRGVRIKHRQYRLKTYKNCFIASEAVDYMVQSGIALSRGNAVEICRRLSSELDYLHHVTNDHIFDDGYFFFRFNTVQRAKSSGTGHNSSFSNSFSMMETDCPLRSERLQFERNVSLRKAELFRLKAIRKKMSERLQIVLVGGPSGCGKSCLVSNALADDPTVIFSSARFDQRSQWTPFQTLRLLFTDICKQIRVSLDIGRLLHELEREFKGADAQKSVLASWIPEMGNLFKSTPDQKSLPTCSDNMSIMQLSLHSFLRALSTMTPIIICLDDITCSDSRTLEILHFLLTRRDMRNVMFCATFRDNELHEGHCFIQWQAELRDHSISFETILLRNLNLVEIQAFLATCLKQEEEDVHDLAELLIDRTRGNFFFLVQTLESLQDLFLICYDSVSLRWIFSVDEIRRKTRVADNVGELLATRIEQLPRDVQQVLKLGACFGSGFDPEILERTKAVLYIFDDIDICLQSACEEDLLIRVSARQYVFAHDHIQSAAYHLLPEGDDRKRIHWEIGLKLSTTRLPIDEGNFEWYFAVADQMKLAGEVLKAEIRHEDRSRIADIFLKAGKQASTISAFSPAAKYFGEGIDVLGGDVKTAFATNYRLSAKLFLAYAQALISAGDVDQSRKTSEALALASRNDEDKRSANMAVFRCFSAENNLEEQIDFGLQLLGELGVKIPKLPNRVQLSREYDRAMSELKGYSESELLGLPPMSDRNIEGCINILCTLLQSGKSLGRINFVSYTLARLVQLTLRHGICKFTPLILVLVGQDLMASSVHDLKGGQHFIRMGLSFNENIEIADIEKGSLLAQSCMAIGCVEPLSKSMVLGLDAYKISLANGDMSNAFHGVSVYLLSFYYSGLPFKPLLEDVEKFAMQMLEYKQTRYFFYTIPIFQLLLCLSGQEENNHDISKGRAVAMISLVEGENHDVAAEESLMSYGMQIAVYMGDDEKALGYYQRLKDINMGLGKASASYHVRLFFFGLICVHNFRQSRKSHFKVEAKKYMETLRDLVDGGAINLPHKLMLLEAEFASVTAKDSSSSEEIVHKYEKSIFAAGRAGFLQDGGLANFLCAQFRLREGNMHSAETYLLQAHSVYSSWGAIAVANTIKEKHPNLFSDVDTRSRRSSSGFRSRTQFRESFALMHKSLSKARGISSSVAAVENMQRQSLSSSISKSTPTM